MLQAVAGLRLAAVPPEQSREPLAGQALSAGEGEDREKRPLLLPSQVAGRFARAQGKPAQQLQDKAHHPLVPPPFPGK